MKILFFCVVIFFYLFQDSMAQSRGKLDSIVMTYRNLDSRNKYEIWSIDSVQSVFIIYAKRNDSIVKIVTKKERVNECKPILKGQLYDLKIESLLNHFSSKRHIGGVKYNGILVKLEGGEITWDLFICEDLKGLCYIPSSQSACKKKKSKKGRALQFHK